MDASQTILPNTAGNTVPAFSEEQIRKGAVVFLQAGDYQSARDLLRAGLAAGVSSPALFSDFATVEFLLGEADTAEAALRSALRLNPRHLTAKRNLAELLLVTNRYEEALFLFTELLPQLQPEDQKRINMHLAPRQPAPPHSDAAARQIWEALAGVRGLRRRAFQVDLKEFARLACASTWAMPPYFYQKKLEYYLSTVVLDLNSQDRYVDIASQVSPFPSFVQRVFGCQVYQQGLQYESGLHGVRIGGNAAEMPVPDGFFSKMTLHCSFEHFEDDSDTAFIREAARVLAPGGRVCIVPLYMNTEYTLNEREVLSYGAQTAKLKAGCEFSRHYDAGELEKRVVAPARDLFDVEVFHMTNLQEIRDTLPSHQKLYAHFMLVLTRLDTPLR